MPHDVDMVYLTKVEPLLTAVTRPVELMVAIAVLSLLQVPPDGALLSSEVSPMHNMPLPVIASGGVGLLSHFYDGLVAGKADAVLAASVFHFGTFTIPQVKKYLGERGVEVRS